MQSTDKYPDVALYSVHISLDFLADRFGLTTILVTTLLLVSSSVEFLRRPAVGVPGTPPLS